MEHYYVLMKDRCLFTDIRFGYDATGLPFLCLHCPNTPKVINELNENPEYRRLILRGNCSINENTVTFKFNKKNDILVAIDEFKYIYKVSYVIRDEINKFETELLKLADPMYPPSRESQDYTTYHLLDRLAEETVHPVRKARRPSGISFFKASVEIHDPGLEDLEAANAALYRIILGVHRAPNVRTVYDRTSYQCLGTASKEIPAFKSLSKLFYEQNYKTQQQHINAGLAELMVASYMLEENDGHAGNIGYSTFNGEDILVRIDCDRSVWSLTGPLYIRPQAIKDKFFPKQTDGLAMGHFTLTAKDLINFPDIKDSNPYYWFSTSKWSEPPKQATKDYSTNTFIYNFLKLKGIRENPEFLKRKWKAFLKCSLITDEMINHIGGQYISDMRLRNKYVDYLKNKFSELRRILYAMPEFKRFLRLNPTVSEKIIAEFEEYNKEASGLSRHPLKIDIRKIREATRRLVPTITYDKRPSPVGTVSLPQLSLRC